MSSKIFKNRGLLSTASLSSNSKIVIVGTSGAGKSTLARKLSARHNLADIELDALHWEPNWTPARPDVFRERIKAALATKQGWVVHGNYSKVQDLTWGAATHLIWLDYPRRVVFWRVFKRSVIRTLTQEELWSGNKESFRKTFLSKDSILLWSLQTFSLRRRQYQKMRASPEYQHLQVKHLKNPSEVSTLISL
jgi:adenylate kinase family enzyme